MTAIGKPTRAQYAKFVSDQKTILEFEALFLAVNRLLASPVVYSQAAPTAMTTAATMTTAALLGGIITGTHAAGATQAYTLPTGTLLDAAMPSLQVDEAFEWTLLNLSAAALDTITLTAGTDHTIVGNAVVQSAHATTGALYGSSATWITRKTAANTFATYRRS